MAANINAFEIFAKIGLDGSAFTKGLNTAKSAASKFGSTTKSIFSKFGGFVSNMFKGLLSKVKNFFSQAKSKAAEFESAMAQVAATMGKSIEEVNAEIATVEYKGKTFTGNLKEYAMELGATTKYTSTQVAEAMNYMALAGYDTQKTMEMLPTVLNLASAGGMELARASDVVTDVQTAFGASTERTTQMIDEMAKAASTGNTSVAQLGDAFLTVGGLAKEVGGGMVTLSDGTKAATDNIQEIEIALVAMANAGVKGSEAGMHMRNMLLKLASPTESGTLKLEELGVSVFDAAGQMRSLSGIFRDLNEAFKDKTAQERLDAISTLFNARDTTSAQALLAAINGTNWDKIGESVLQYDGAAEKMANTMMNTMKGASDLFNSALDNFQITIANAVGVSGGNLANLVRFGADAISAMTEGYKSFGVSGLIDAFTGQVEKVVDELGNKIAPILSAVTKVVKRVIRKLPSIIRVFVPNIITALAEIVTQIMDTIMDKDLIDSLQKSMKNVKFILTTYWKNNGEELKKTGEEIFEFLVNGLLNAAEFIGDNLLPIITNIAHALTSDSTLGKIVDVAGQILDKLIEGLTSEESLKAFFDPNEGAPVIIGKIVAALGTALGKLIDAATDIIAALCGFFTDPKTETERRKASQAIIDGLQTAFEVVCTSVNNGVLKIGAALMGGIVDSIDYDTTAADVWGMLLDALWNHLKYGKPSLLKAQIAYNDPVNGGAGNFDEFYKDYVRQYREYIDEHPFLRFGWDESGYQDDSTLKHGFQYDPSKAQINTGDALLYMTPGGLINGDIVDNRYKLEKSMQERERQAEEQSKQEKAAARHDAEQAAANVIYNYISRSGVQGVPFVSEAMGGTQEEKWAASQGISAAAGAIPHYGSGGIVTKPTLALIGEDGAEAVVPLDGSTKASLKGVGNNVTIQFGNIYVQGGQNTGQEVVKQIDTALRQYQVQQERGAGGTAWLKSIRYQTERAH